MIELDKGAEFTFHTLNGDKRLKYSEGECKDCFFCEKNDKGLFYCDIHATGLSSLMCTSDMIFKEI